MGQCFVMQIRQHGVTLKVAKIDEIRRQDIRGAQGCDAGRCDGRFLRGLIYSIGSQLQNLEIVSARFLCRYDTMN